MDPLSITVSVLTLLQLTQKVIDYARRTKDAPKERIRVLQEASSLVGLLITLRSLVDDCNPQDPWLQATSSLATSDGPFEQYKCALEKLVEKIMPSGGLRGTGQVLLWKFSKEEVLGLLSQIERVKSLIDIALGMDDMLVYKVFHTRPLQILIVTVRYHVRSRRICNRSRRALPN
jgi:hypothetical protein